MIDKFEKHLVDVERHWQNNARKARVTYSAYLLLRLQEELGELTRSIIRIDRTDTEMLDEFADVCNIFFLLAHAYDFNVENILELGVIKMDYKKRTGKHEVS